MTTNPAFDDLLELIQQAVPFGGAEYVHIYEAIQEVEIEARAEGAAEVRARVEAVISERRAQINRSLDLDLWHPGIDGELRQLSRFKAALDGDQEEGDHA